MATPSTPTWSSSRWWRRSRCTRPAPDRRADCRTRHPHRGPSHTRGPDRLRLHPRDAGREGVRNGAGDERRGRARGLNELVQVLVAERERDARCGADDLRDAVLPGALTRAAHRQEITGGELELHLATAALWPQQESA